MQTTSTISATRQCIQAWRQAGQSIAFVPTMGNLHAGHIKLVTTAKQNADKVVVSIFVNPTQFGPNEDFVNYPRTETQDQLSLLENEVDLLFLPTVEEIYPEPTKTVISAKILSTLYCGASRPGHFDGVTLVVCKLLNIVQPDLLLLGEKDFQQLTIIRNMIDDLNFPVKILSVPTFREDDGLAMSSRNIYLSPAQRQLAPLLYQSLCFIGDEILAGNRDYQALTNQQVKILQEAGFFVDYYDICRIADLLIANKNDQNLVILIAAKLGATRLIDNILLQITDNKTTLNYN
jgi:pantoate--beta-alanine ligase